jgi:hypothetical protein
VLKLLYSLLVNSVGTGVYKIVETDTEADLGVDSFVLVLFGRDFMLEPVATILHKTVANGPSQLAAVGGYSPIKAAVRVIRRSARPPLAPDFFIPRPRRASSVPATRLNTACQREAMFQCQEWSCSPKSVWSPSA